MNKTLYITLGVIIAIAFAIGGYRVGKRGSATASPAPQQTEVESFKIGLMLPLSGEAASYGQPGQEVYLLAQEQINGRGGIGGKKLEFIIEDSKCSGKDAVGAAQKLMEVHKVKVITGLVCSSEALAVIPIAEANQVFLFAGAASSPSLTGKSQWFARVYPSDTTQGEALASVSQELGFKTVGFVVEQLDYPLGIYKAYATRFETGGGRITKEEFPKDTTDFRSILAKLQGQNVDALFIDTQAPAAAERILQQIQESQWRPRILLSDSAIGDPGLVAKYASLLENGLGAEVSVDETNSKYREFIEAHKATYGHELGFPTFSQMEYDSAFLLADALAAVGDNPQELSKWMRTVKNWPGVSGSITISPNGDRFGGHIPKIIKNGKAEVYKK